MKNFHRVLTGLAFLLMVGNAEAQTPICFKPTSGSGCTPVSAAAPLPVTSSGGGGAVTLASGAVASGAYSSGAYAAGALAAGAFAVGAGVDGWDLTQGARADPAWTTGSGSVISLLKAIATANIVTNRAVNIAQINGVTPLMGNGVTGTGSPRVTIASDNTAFSVNAIQSGTWTMQPGNTANTTPWLVTSSSAIAPVSTMNSATANAGITSAMAGVFDDASPTAITENSFGFVRMSANRNQYTTLRDAAGNERGVNVTAGNALTVDASASTQPVSGSVAVTSVIPGTAATNLGKAEDSAHASGDVGVFGLALANEAQTVLAQDGDYIGHGADTKGNTFVTGPVASAATDSGNPVKIGGRYNSAVQAFTNGQRADLQVDQRGGLLVQDGQAIPSVSVTSAATLFMVADTSGYGSISLQVTSAGTSCTITYETTEDNITWAPAAGTPPSNTGTTAAMVTTSTAIGQFNFNTYGKMFRARVSTYGSGTVTIQGTLRKDVMPRASIGIGGNVSVAGTVGEASAVGSGMLPTAYEGRTTNKTAVTTGQYVRPIATSIGAAVNKPFQVPELDWSYPAAAGGISNTTTAVTMVAAAGAGIRNYLTAIQVSAGALGAASEIAVRDGAGGTVIWRGFISTAGGNQSVNLSSPIKSTANTLLEVVTLTATITGAVYINAQGYQAP